MKFFAATLLACAALGVNLQQNGKGPLGEDLRKEIKGAVRGLIKDVDANGNGKISANEVRRALRAAGAEPKLTNAIVRGFKEEMEGKQLPTDVLMQEVLDGAREAIKEGATRDQVRQALVYLDVDYVAKNGVPGLEHLALF